MTLADGTATWLPALPIELDHRRLQGRLDPPRLGEHSVEVAESLGYSRGEIAELMDAGVLIGANAVAP